MTGKNKKTKLSQKVPQARPGSFEALQAAHQTQGGGVASSLLNNAGVGFHAPPAQTLDQKMSAARAQHMSGNLEQAEALYKSVLKVAPQHSACLALYGILLKQKERWAEAQRYLKKSIKLNPNEAEAHNGLGMVFRHLGKYQEAIASFRKAAELDPEHPGPVNNMGIVYREIGQFENAAECFERAVSMDPAAAEAWHGLAQTRKSIDDPDTMDRLKTLVDSAQLGPNAKRHAALALGKFCDAAGQFDDAFGYFTVAKSDRQDPDAWKADCDLMNSVAAAFNRDTFSSLPEAVVQQGEPVPVMVLGMPRSGTTLAEQILASHPAVEGGGELQFFRDRAGRQKDDGIVRIPDYPQRMPDVETDILTRIRRGFFKEFKTGKSHKKSSRKSNSGDHKRFVTDKTPFNFLYLGLITQVLPDVKIVHCRRNPLDTILSIYFTDFSTNFPFTEDLLAIGREYIGYQKLMTHWREHSPVPIFDLYYEELINNQEAVTRDLLRYCEIPWDDKCLNYHKTERQVSTPSDWQVRQPIFRGSMERWRNYEQHLTPLLDLMRSEGIVE